MPKKSTDRLNLNNKPISRALYPLAKSIFNAANEPLLVLNKELKVLMANPAFSDAFKIPKEACLGKNFLNLGDGEWNEDKIKKSISKILKHHQGFRNLKIIKEFKKIGYRNLSLSGKQIILQDSSREIILLTIKDLTKEKELEQAQIDSQLILESITDSFIAFDNKWRYTYINKNAETLLGKKRRALIGKILWEESPQAKSTEIGKRMLHAMKEKQAAHFEAYSPVLNKWLEVNIYPTSHGITNYFRDISEEKTIEQQKDEFVSVISHELKTPVTSISAFTQLLLQKAEKENDKVAIKYLQRTEFYTHRLTSLITGLLNSENLRASQFEFRDSEFLLDELIAQTVEDLRPSTPNHKLIIRGKTGAKLTADPERLHQVLINLILNAVRYSPNAHKVNIAVEVVKKRVVIGIKDYGIGISEKNQQKIFERFFQVNSPKRELSSIGLGLDISANIVKHYGGEIWVKSTENKGSTFFFSLPLKRK